MAFGNFLSKAMGQPGGMLGQTQRKRPTWLGAGGLTSNMNGPQTSTMGNYSFSPDRSSFIDTTKNPNAKWQDFQAGSWGDTQAGWYGDGGMLEGQRTDYNSLKNAGLWNPQDEQFQQQFFSQYGDWQNDPHATVHMFGNMGTGTYAKDWNAPLTDEGNYQGLWPGQGDTLDNVNKLYGDIFSRDYLKQVEEARQNQQWKAEHADSWESTFKDYFKEVAPMATLIAGGMFAPGISSFLGGGLTGAAGAGAAMGGLNAGLSGQNILKGAATGGLAGGAGYGIGQMFGGAPATGVEGGGGGGPSSNMYADAGNSGIVNDAIPDTFANNPIGTLASETGSMMPRAVVDAPALLEGGLTTPDQIMSLQNSGATILDYQMPSMDFDSFETSGMDSEDQVAPTMEEQLPTEPTPVGSYEGTSFDSGMDFSAGGEIPLSQQYPNIESSTMDKLLEAYGKIKDPMKVIGGLGQMYMSNRNADQLREYLQQQQAQGFDHRQFDQLARNYQDPQMRMQMLRQTPGFLESQRFMTDEMQRKLAAQGKFMQPGQGGAVSNNWAVPMMDVVGKHAMDWDKQIFGQIQGLTGMGFDPAASRAQLAQGFIPAAINQEDKGWHALMSALESNKNLIPDALKGLSSFLA